jgi:hypothetical protein
MAIALADADVKRQQDLPRSLEPIEFAGRPGSIATESLKDLPPAETEGETMLRMLSLAKPLPAVTS